MKEEPKFFTMYRLAQELNLQHNTDNLKSSNNNYVDANNFSYFVGHLTTLSNNLFYMHSTLGACNCKNNYPLYKTH